jgi:hypothetical protein
MGEPLDRSPEQLNIITEPVAKSLAPRLIKFSFAAIINGYANLRFALQTHYPSIGKKSLRQATGSAGIFSSSRHR